MTNLVIVAGGLGSRLAPLTNHIPKFLVNIGKNTGYVEMIRYWSKQIRFDRLSEAEAAEVKSLGQEPKVSHHTLTVIVHPAYEALTRAYHKLYFPNIDLIVKTVSVADGSAHAILSTCDHLIGKSVLFSWCDVLPAETIDMDAIWSYGQNVVFTNYKNSNRYGVHPRNPGSPVKIYLDENERGGCFGLYYIHAYTNAIGFKDGQDFIEVLHQFPRGLVEQPIENIIDFGDMPKLIRTRSHSDEAREFNSIEFVGDYVMKTATNKQGEGIIEREGRWYQEMEDMVGDGPRPPVPRAWIGTDHKSLLMSRVPGVPIWKAWPDLSFADRAHVLKQVIEGEDQLFRLKTYEPLRQDVIRDVRIEAGEKLLSRYAEIEDVLNAFGTIRRVNGHDLETLDPRVTINRLTEALVDHYTRARNEYGFIHGDLQFSNSMVDLNTLKVSIIDPRGYFGKTIGYGLQDYDIGKLLYALSGYDVFNYSKDFGIVNLGHNEILFSMWAPDQRGVSVIMAEHFKPVHSLWLAVCWLGLAQFIRNDPVKSVCAHYRGLVMAENALKQISL